MNTCQRCLLPEGRFSVKLNDRGICNYCAYWDANKARFSDFKELKSRLAKKLTRYKGRFQYDALVGVSGGKDSTYIAYKLTKEYGLKILTTTYDNGFLSDIAKRNVRNLVKKLGVDHVFFAPNWDVHKSFYQVAFERLGDPCIACAISGYFLATKACFERKIPIFVHGRSPFQMFRNYCEGSRDVFVPMMEANLRDLSFEDLARLYAGVEMQLKGSINQFFQDEVKRQKVYDEFFLDSRLLGKEFAPEFVGFFLFEPYDEDSIKNMIVKELGWERSRDHDAKLSHSDCRIHDAAVYMYQEVQGMSMLAPEVAVMLRMGVIKKEEVEGLLAGGQPREDLMREAKDYFCQRLGLGPKEFSDALQRLKQRAVGKFDSH